MENSVVGRAFFLKSKKELENHIRDILLYIGEDPKREGLVQTPERVLKSYESLFAGYYDDPEKILSVTFSETQGYDEMVLLKDVSFYSFCEHHLLPIVGKVHIAYIPKGRVVGLSKLSRIVECYARRLQIQERLTNQISESLEKFLFPVGVAVYIEAQHYCVRSRGIRKEQAMMITSSYKGIFKDDPVKRSEFLLSIAS